MKKIMFVMPLLTLSFLASCNKGGGNKVQFTLSSEQPTVVEEKTATIYVDWKPTDHIIKFESFTFIANPVRENTVTFEQTGDPRPMPVKITFKDDINEDINGTLSFTYEDVTAKTNGESSIEVTISKPESYDVSFSSDQYDFEGDSKYRSGEEYTCTLTPKTYETANESLPKYKDVETNDVSIKVGNSNLKRGVDYKVENSTLTIFANPKIKGEMSIDAFQGELVDDFTWDKIIEIATSSEAGGPKASSIFKAGDYKKASNNVFYRMIGFDHETIVGGNGTTTAAITFESMSATSFHNFSSSPTGGTFDFTETTLYSTLNDSSTGDFSELPDEIKDSVKNVNKLNAFLDGECFTTYLFPLSIVEFGFTNQEEKFAGTPYEFYTNVNSDRLFKGEVSYWTRDVP
ncbi:MAG: hypothetical protein MJ208_02840, partial [Bacilli bacterium]|nr:hypothetical protein [Bacilli bacterium]